MATDNNEIHVGPFEVLTRNFKTGATLGIVYPVQSEDEAVACFEKDRQDDLELYRDLEFVKVTSYADTLARREQKWSGEQEMGDAFNAAFLEWKDSTPEVAEYVRNTGHSIIGLQNMLFHFFKAGFEFVSR